MTRFFQDVVVDVVVGLHSFLSTRVVLFRRQLCLWSENIRADIRSRSVRYFTASSESFAADNIAGEVFTHGACPSGKWRSFFFVFLKTSRCNFLPAFYARTFVLSGAKSTYWFIKNGFFMLRCFINERKMRTFSLPARSLRSSTIDATPLL